MSFCVSEGCTGELAVESQNGFFCSEACAAAYGRSAAEIYHLTCHDCGQKVLIGDPCPCPASTSRARAEWDILPSVERGRRLRKTVGC